MASISRDPNGRRRILFVDADGNRKTIRLGKTSQRMAEEIKIKVETLNAAKIGGCSLDRETAAWVAKLGDDLHAKLAAVGLSTTRTAARLGDFIAAYIARRTDVAPRTVLNLEICGRRLTDHFGADRDMRSINEGDADGWILWMKEWPYAEATISRSMKRAKQFFRAAIRAKLITANPFDGIKVGGQTNDARQFHVSRESIAKAIDAAPDHEWRLLIALSRYGGLRCPSEHLALEWRDIDWEGNRFLVRSSKTGERWVPIFPELRPHLEESFERAEEGAVHVILRCRDTSTNLRTQFTRIIHRAGLKPWPKLFHNLRASRETELAATFPLHVVCEWIGNTAAIAAKHYLTVTEEDFKRASQGGAESGAREAQNRAQQPSARDGQGIAIESEAESKCGDKRILASLCGDKQNNLVPPG